MRRQRLFLVLLMVILSLLLIAASECDNNGGGPETEIPEPTPVASIQLCDPAEGNGLHASLERLC